MGELTDIASSAYEKGLCERCTGRMFAKLGTGLTNPQRGIILKQMVSEEGTGDGLDGGEEHFLSVSQDPPNADEFEDKADCPLCEGLFGSVDVLLDVVVAGLSEWEYDTFLLGTRPDPEMVEKEEALWTELDAKYPEPMKTEMNREIGKRVEIATNSSVDFKRPDIVAVLDVLYQFVEVESNPAFFYGRYQKHERGIPQTRWPCRRCGGKGCERCDDTGKMYATSVEELTCIPIMKELDGSEHSFHGMGREDIDAKMLGTGRPFVAEIKHPKKRKLDLSVIQDRINQEADGRIVITELRTSSKDEVRRIKDATSDKSYKVRVEFTAPVDDDSIAKIATLAGVELQQRTPQRVSHRRADKVRKRRILEIASERVNDTTLDISIKAASGTYIKEFCHGDENRTTPSVAQLIGEPCSVLHLDVLEIHDVEE